MDVRRCSAILTLAVLGVSGWTAVLPTMGANGADTSVTAPPVSARRALSTNVTELKVDNIALSKVVDFLKDVSGTNIVVNWKVLEGAGVAKDTPISLEVRELTLRKMMRLVLDQASPSSVLVFNVDANVIEVTTQEDADKVMIIKVYDVEDLVMTDNSQVTPPTMDLKTSTTGGTMSGQSGGGGGATGSIFTTTETAADGGDTKEKRGADLASLVRDVVRPQSWVENGGHASIKYSNGKLIVNAPASVHEAIGGPVNTGAAQRFGM